MTPCVDGTERQATIAFALVGAGLTTRPLMRTVTASGSITTAESLFRITPRTKTSGFAGCSGAQASKADPSHEQGWKCALSCDRSRWFELDCLLERAELELQCGSQAALPDGLAHERSSRVGLVIRETRTPILRHQLASSPVSRPQRSMSIRGWAALSSRTRPGGWSGRSPR